MAKNRDDSAGSSSSAGSEVLGAHAKRQSNNVASSAIEFGARAFDLCSALVNASQPTSAIVRSTQDLIKWLARERIDEYSFTKCAEKARSLAYPNSNGVAIRNQIDEADKRLHAVRGAPIGLLVSGSLGRLMARDTDYCYIVSTVTVLALYYGHQRLTDILTSMMLDEGKGHADGVFYTYEVQREPIRAVVTKIIESVFLNVVNAGHKLGGLPPELGGYHPHIVDHLTFAGIVMGIQQSDADVLIKSQHFLADIVAWLLYHFEGQIEVSVGTKKLLLILGHAVADSLGARDVSALAEPPNILAAMYKLLSNLIKRECIIWDDWFTVAIATSVGIDSDTIGASQYSKIRSGNGATSLVAAQMGSFIAVAPWLDLSRETTVKGCFGLQFYEGNLQPVAEDIALLRSEIGMESNGTSSGQESSGSELNDPQTEDSGEAQLSTAIFRIDSSMYRLMTLVKVNRHVRIVDPTQTLHALMRAEFPRCAHDKLWGIKPDQSEALRLTTFEGIIGDWDSSHASAADTINGSLLLTSSLKVNATIGLCRNGIVIRDTSLCCLGCAMKAVPDACKGAPLRLVQRTKPNRLLRRA